MKNLYQFFIIGIIMFCAVSFSVAETVETESVYAVNNQGQEGDVFCKNQSNALDSFQRLHDAFAKEKTIFAKREDEYTVDGLYKDQFFSDYAGAYINTSGKLVIRLVKDQNISDQEETIDRIIKVCQTSDLIFETEIAEYSYGMLVSSMTDLMNIMEDGNSQLKESICGFGIDDADNTVIVFVNTTDDDIKEEIKERITYPDTIAFVFQNTRDINSAVSTNCGYGIGKSTSIIDFSIGYCAKYTNSSGDVVKGFVTCGHAFVGITNAKAIYTSSGRLGTFVPSKYQYSRKIDAAFVKLYGTSTVSHTIGNTSKSVSSSQTLYLPQGSTVKYFGKNSINLTPAENVPGVVEVSSFTSTCDDGVTLVDMVKASYKAKLGDSGGIVYGTSNGVNCVAGVQSRISTGVTPAYSVYCKVANINAYLGLSIR